MKSLVKYIIEGLKSEYQQWFNKVYQTQQALVKDNKIQPIQVDINKLNKPERTFTLQDFSTDPIVKKLIGDRHIGFTVINQMIRNEKQYILDETKQMNPECIPYWYQDGNNIYFVGLCIFDRNASYIDNFIHLIGIESSLIVEESLPLNKAILNDFIKFIEGEKQKFIGISAKPMHPKMKASLIKLGFTISKDNKEILLFKL